MSWKMSYYEEGRKETHPESYWGVYDIKLQKHEKFISFVMRGYHNQDTAQTNLSTIGDKSYSVMSDEFDKNFSLDSISGENDIYKACYNYSKMKEDTIEITQDEDGNDVSTLVSFFKNAEEA